MNKRNTWFGIIAIIIIAAAVIYAVVHKSDNNDNNTSGNNTSSQNSTGSNTPNQSTAAQVITTKTDPSVGDFLADGNGKPLYTYGGDSNGVSNCTGACLAEWPIYAATSSSANLPTNVTIITRSDSRAQYAYKGLPLYYFTNDGSTPTGDGISDFHLAKP